MKQRAPLQSACKSFEEDLVLYYYGETDEVEQRRVQQHLSQCVSVSRFSRRSASMAAANR